MPISEVTVYDQGNMQEYKILYIGFPINRENISNNPICLMKLTGLIREGNYFNDTKFCLEVLFWSHESFASLRFLNTGVIYTSITVREGW